MNIYEREGLNMEEDCYFWIDQSVPEEEQTMNVLCVDCHQNSPEVGWLWEGSKKGYGPYDFICDNCKKVIHEGPDKGSELNENDTASD